MADTPMVPEVEYEVWQDDMPVASADRLADAQHYMAMYGQDGPVKAMTAFTYRVPGFTAEPPLSASPVRDGLGAPVAWRWKPDAATMREEGSGGWRLSDHEVKVGKGRGTAAVVEVQPLYTRPTPATPEGLREAEARFVAGPVWQEAEVTDEDGEPIWTSEVQTIGGYSVIATVHGGSAAEVIARRDAILSALQPQAQGGE